MPDSYSGSSRLVFFVGGYVPSSATVHFSTNKTLLNDTSYCENALTWVGLWVPYQASIKFS